MRANPLQNGVEYLEVNQILFLSLEISSMVTDGEEKLKLRIHCPLKNLLRVHLLDTTANISPCCWRFFSRGVKSFGGGEAITSVEATPGMKSRLKNLLQLCHSLRCPHQPCQNFWPCMNKTASYPGYAKLMTGLKVCLLWCLKIQITATPTKTSLRKYTYKLMLSHWLWEYSDLFNLWNVAEYNVQEHY